MDRQGSNLLRIKELTGATLSLATENVAGNPLAKMLTITGDRRGVEAGRNEIFRTLQEISGVIQIFFVFVFLMKIEENKNNLSFVWEVKVDEEATEIGV